MALPNPFRRRKLHLIERLPTDSGHVLIVDPAHLPADVLDALLNRHPNIYGAHVPLAVILECPSDMHAIDVVTGKSDGTFRVFDPGSKHGDFRDVTRTYQADLLACLITAEADNA